MDLRYPAILVFSLLFATISCKKSNDSPGQNNTQPDTAYLLKTDLTYYYDSAGSRTQDSSIFKWAYDAQKRISAYTSEYTDGTKEICAGIVKYMPCPNQSYFSLLMTISSG
jgi:hypothetical protein